MPAFADQYRNARQTRDPSSSTPSSSSIPASSSAGGISAGAVGGVFGATRPRIYPREYNARNPKSPHLSHAGASPLLSALQNPSELFTRSIPFPSFPGSSPSSGAPNSLGSAAGGVGLSGGPSPPPSAPASYSSAGGFSVPRAATRYHGFEEQYSAPNSTPGGHFYGKRYPQHHAQVNGHGGTTAAHVQPGQNSYAVELQNIDDLGLSGNPRNDGPAPGDNVVCLGWEGGVDIWRVGRGVVEQVGRLEGLSGGVKSAKILPNAPVDDPLASQRPLICLTVHSPIRKRGEGDVDQDQPAILLDGDSPYSASPPSGPQTRTEEAEGEQEWQTTVEVWSLASKTRLATLFTSPPIQPNEVGFGIHAPPPVWGGLRTQVTANRIAVGLGTSGELYVFGTQTSGEKTEWKCLEKLWTCVQYRNGSSPGDANAPNFDPGMPLGGMVTVGTPVFDLSGRWLAYCPASAGSLSAGGEVGVEWLSPSVGAQSPPQQPAISAAVSLEDEAFLNKMAREVTQEVIRGAKWATEAGLKKLQGYWSGMGAQNGSPPSSVPTAANGYAQSTGSATTLHHGGHSQPSGLGQQLRQMHQGNLPPQQYQLHHPQPSHEPRLVSILDLDTLPSTNNDPPMATFLPPAGVSYLSFAPGGLTLLTVSSKGDLIFIWDLLKLVHSSTPSPSSSAPPGRHIRQIARFTRMTVANVIDIDWFAPRGDKLAVVTDKGTAHFYTLPYSALQWPPPTRPPPSSTAINSSQTTAASAALSLLTTSTQPLLTAARRRKSRSSSSTGNSPSSLPIRRPTTTPPDAAGNKIPLPPGTIAPGCIKFLTAKENGHVALVAGGLLRIYELSAGGVAGSTWEYDLPLLPAARGDGVGAGFWGLGRRAEERAERGTTVAWAEVETCAGWTPWHQERRVRMWVYTPENTPEQPHEDPPAPWTEDAPAGKPAKKPKRKAAKQQPSPPPPPPPLVPQEEKNHPWVFGRPVPAERIYLSDAGGHALDGLEDVMAGCAVEEGFFEQEAEVLEI